MKAQFSSTPKILASSNLTYWVITICIVSIAISLVNIKMATERKK
jgi:general stress protein CsbA